MGKVHLSAMWVSNVLHFYGFQCEGLELLCQIYSSVFHAFDVVVGYLSWKFSSALLYMCN